MPDFIFAPILFFLSCLRIILSVILFWLPDKRRDFEERNLSEKEAESFKKTEQVADFCFEVSSEGELEQVRPLLSFYLENKRKIELIFSSPSVEKKCLDLALKHKEQIRILRMPILTTQLVQNWITAPVIIFCRYDFFPELLILKYFEKKLVLLSGSVKNISWYKKNVFRLFKVIVAASTTEEERFKTIAPMAETFAYDFRIPRIAERLEKSAETLGAVSELKQYFDFLRTKNKNDLIIIGSAWESDLEIFNHPDFILDIKNSKIHVLIVPHQLGLEKILKIEEFFKNLGLAEHISVIDENKAIKNVSILNKSGILCELYSLFNHAYVGGGYERSIHSVLEPFFSGAEVFVGPKTHRSTEYEFLVSIAPLEIHVLNRPEDFYNIFMKNKNIVLDQNIRHHWCQGPLEIIAKIGSVIDVK